MTKDPRKSPMMNLIAGGGAGATESIICHPLDTIKTRMQLSRSAGRSLGPYATAKRIVRNEGFFSLYKGIGAVVSGIVPKMAIRFTSFEYFKGLMADEKGKVATKKVFLAGLMSGVCEAIFVVTPMDVVKIRLQAQTTSLSEPMEWHQRKYRGLVSTATQIIREEGPLALYKGVIPTVLRQATNQAVNFTMYQEMKKQWMQINDVKELQPWQHLLIGGFSGGMGPIANSPIDVIKTRLQKQKIVPGKKPMYDGVIGCITTTYHQEGLRAFYKGLTPRLLRIAPGQAITFMTYEAISKRLMEYSYFNPQLVSVTSSPAPAS